MKRLAARLPVRWQNELRRVHFARQLASGSFAPDEPEVALLPGLISEGDWVVDIGANVGQYTKCFSDLVGPLGRVIAVEPVPATHALLAANVQLFRNSNVALLNVAASSEFGLATISVPRLVSGLPNYYEAHLSLNPDSSSLTVMTLPIDSLGITHRVALVKIDVEGHELRVLDGMKGLVARDQPVIIVETRNPNLLDALAPLAYESERLDDSPNLLLRPSGVHEKEICR